MKLKEINNKIKIELTKSEGLVFAEALAKLNEMDIEKFGDAENNILWSLENYFEPVLVEPFQDDYLEIMKDAENDILGDKK